MLKPYKQTVKGSHEDYANKWNYKYPYDVKSWKENWEELTKFFEFPTDDAILKSV